MIVFNKKDQIREMSLCNFKTTWELTKFNTRWDLQGFKNYPMYNLKMVVMKECYSMPLQVKYIT